MPPPPAERPTRRPAELMRVLTTMVVVLGTFGTALVVRSWADLGGGLVVLAVVLALTLARIDVRTTWTERALQLVTLLVVAVLARYVAQALLHHDVIGGGLLVLGLSVPIALRRLGPPGHLVGRVMSLPFVAVLTTPVVAAPDHPETWWAPVMALVAYAWVVVATAVGAAAGLSTPTAHGRPARPSRRRLDASTRMAIQMAVAVSAALLVGHLAFGEHWPWVVITAFVVCSGNRGRADVVVKGVQRVAGALAGTAVATVVGALAEPGSRWTIVAIFVVLALGVWLRGRSYAYWAAAVTGVLALLYGYYGQGGSDLLVQRLGGIVVGGVIATLASWFVIPVRTRDVALRRVADVLAAAQDVMSTTLREEPVDHSVLDHGLQQLDQVRPAWVAHRRLTRGTDTTAHAMDAVDDVAEALHALGTRPERPTLGRAARLLGAVRVRLRDERTVAGLTPDLERLVTLLREARSPE